jgi:hypothetical protein
VPESNANPKSRTIGYGTPLPRKLGIREGDAVALVRAPEGFRGTLARDGLPDGVRFRSRLGRDHEVIVAFFTRRAELERRFEALTSALDVDGGLWIAWPKRASGVATDITEDTVREVALPRGLVDNKVCAIDERGPDCGSSSGRASGQPCERRAPNHLEHAERRLEPRCGA